MMHRFTISLVASGALACSTTPTFHGVDVSSGQSIELRHVARDPSSLPACMPASRNRELAFTGTYLSPQLGVVNLVTGNRSERQGDFHYRSCGCEVTGMIHGWVDDNLMRFEWSEDAPHCGAGWHARGKGRLFASMPPQDDRPLRLYGNHAYSVVIADIKSGSYHTEIRDAGVLTAVRLAPGDIGADAPRCP